MYKVLIVDNEKSIQTGMRIGIDWNGLGCTVVGTADNGVQALQIIEKKHPDIVLSDVKMEKMDGLTLCRKLEDMFPEIRCILITGFQEFDIALAAANQPNIVKLIMKPTSVFRVAEAVGEAIRIIESKSDIEMLQERIETKQTENRRLRQMLAISKLVSAIHITEKDILALTRELGLSFENYRVIAVLVRREAAEEADVLKTINKHIETVFKDPCFYPVVTSVKQIRILVISGESKPTGGDIRRLCDEFANVIECFTDYSVFVGISENANDPLRIRKVIEEAEEAAQFARVEAKLSVVEYGKLSSVHQKTTCRNVQTYLAETLNAISKLDLAGSRESLKKIYQDASEGNMESGKFRSICLLVIDACMQQMIRYAQFPDKVLAVQTESHNVLQTCYNLQSIYDRTREILEQYLVKPLEKAHTGGRELVENVEKYVKEHFGEELSLEIVAGMFYVSPSYLSRMFKKEREISLIAYIQNVRMKEAIRLAETTRLHAYEIGERVGIPDPVYFSKMFKKTTGFGIREYRNRPGHQDG